MNKIKCLFCDNTKYLFPVSDTTTQGIFCCNVYQIYDYRLVLEKLKYLYKEHKLIIYCLNKTTYFIKHIKIDDNVAFLKTIELPFIDIFNPKEVESKINNLIKLLLLK